MITRFVTHPDVANIAVGDTGCQIESKLTQHGVFLICKKSTGAVMTRAEIIAALGDITVNIDGKPKMTGTATFWLDRFKYYLDSLGAYTVAGAIPILFYPPWAQTLAERSLYAWGMKRPAGNDAKLGFHDLTIDITIADITNLAKIEVVTEVEDTIRELGQHITVGRKTRYYASTGTDEITDLSHQDVNAGAMAIHIEESTGTIEKAEMIVNENLSIWPDLSADFAAMALRKAGRTVQSGYYHLDFARNNDLSSVLLFKNISGYWLKVTFITAAPNSYNIYYENVEGLKAG